MTRRHSPRSAQVATGSLVELLPKDPFVVTGSLPGGTSEEILREICRRVPELGSVTIVCADMSGRYEFLSAIPEGHERDVTVLVGGGALPTETKARVDIMACSTYEFDRAIASGEQKVDATIVVGAPARDGSAIYLSPQVGFLHSAAARSRVVVAEVDPMLPEVPGDTRIALADIDFLVEANAPVDGFRQHAGSDEDEAIAGHVASLVPDGATLQMGIGSVPTGVLARLTDRKNLRIHSGVVAEGLIELIESGAVVRDDARRPAIVASALLGSRRLYDYADGNADFSLRSFGWTNNPDVIAGIDRFHAINSAVSVDILGQVNSEMVGNAVRFSGGGQRDFIHARKNGGAGIIALKSTSSNGLTSRIVAAGERGFVATCHRNHVDFVVTEHGIADLRSKTLVQRAEAIVGVAHPGFRDDLMKAIAAMFSSGNAFKRGKQR